MSKLNLFSVIATSIGITLGRFELIYISLLVLMSISWQRTSLSSKKRYYRYVRVEEGLARLLISAPTEICYMAPNYQE